MKKLLLIALLLTFAASTAIAQQGGPGSQGGGNGNSGNSQMGGNTGSPVDRLAELLGLTDAQIIDIELIFENSQIFREEACGQARAAGEEHRALMNELILAVLTKDQQALYEEHRAQREALKQALEELRNERGFGGGGRGNGNGTGTGTGDCDGTGDCNG